jgi:UDP-N-acetylmuramoyl-tripeptide--D-alanyl-D-alanine ligase
MSAEALWTTDAMARAMRAERSGPLPSTISGISIDTRSIAPGDAFFAIRGDNRDGHEFVPAALLAGAGLAVVAKDHASAMPAGAPLLFVDDVLEALRDLARASRARSTAKMVAVTGSVGKTGTKEALRQALAVSGETYASVASYNNHWGVPLSLSRMPETARFGVFEIGMNHAGEITPLTQLVRPHIAIITTVEPVHLEYLGSIEAIADAKAEIFNGLDPGGAAVLNADNPQFDRLRSAAERSGVARIVTFGTEATADARLRKVSLQPAFSMVEANILGSDVAYKLGAPGRHIVQNSLAVLTAAVLAGADLALAALALANLKAPIGRGARTPLHLPQGEAVLLDESYNANPASMRAAIALLGQMPAGSQGRRIAVLGDMLELGPESEALHAGLSDPILEHEVDLVFCSGPLMRNLWDALPPERRGAYAESSVGLVDPVVDAVRPGDSIMVKGSLGSRMAPVAKALATRYAEQDAPAMAAQG